MKQKSFGIWSALVLLVATTACQKTSPTRPSDGDGGASVQTASVTDAVTGVTVTVPSLVTPTVNQQFKNVEQPITLTIKNAVTTGTTALTYTFEVATDAAFASKAYTKDGVAAGSGTTTLKIDKLAPNKSYFWRARALSGSLAGPYTDARGVGIGPEVIIQAPSLGDPPSGSNIDDQPTLNVNTVQRAGPAGAIFYRFEVAEAASFSSLAYVATVAERTDLPYTPHKVTTKLEEKTYFWRVMATDPTNGVSGPYSNTAQFKVQKGIDLNTAIYVQGPNISKWAETSQITDYEISGGVLCIYHTKLGVWPKAVFPFGDAYIEGNQYVFGQINGQWYGGSADWYRPGQACKALDIHDVFVDSFQLGGGPLSQYRPQSGDIIGIASTTPSRFWPAAATVDERTNVLLVRVP
jgi:hypothetical protein